MVHFILAILTFTVELLTQFGITSLIFIALPFPFKMTWPRKEWFQQYEAECQRQQ